MKMATDGRYSDPQSTVHAKPLWAAVGILGTAVLALGGVMVYQGRNAVPAAQIAVAAAPIPASASAFTSGIPRLTNGAPTMQPGLGGISAADDMVEKPAFQNVKPAPVKKLVKPTLRPAVSPAPSVSVASPVPVSAPAVPAALSVCSNCGAIESVKAIQRTTKADGPGIGAVAGGVAGAVLGHQVGNGNGRTVATVLGAIGGGFAGNAIEKNMKKETVYQVGVRMDDGSRRTLEVAQPPVVGSKVTVDGSTIHDNSYPVYR